LSVGAFEHRFELVPPDASSFLEARENLDRRTLTSRCTASPLSCRLGWMRSNRSHRDRKLSPAESGLSKAARDKGISETAAKRAMRIVAIAPAAQALYRAALPNITRSDRR
jgi:hypothetical protein